LWMCTREMLFCWAIYYMICSSETTEIAEVCRQSEGIAHARHLNNVVSQSELPPLMLKIVVEIYEHWNDLPLKYSNCWNIDGWKKTAGQVVGHVVTSYYIEATNLNFSYIMLYLNVTWITIFYFTVYFEVTALDNFKYPAVPWSH
jgi:hypothetical protein